MLSSLIRRSIGMAAVLALMISAAGAGAQEVSQTQPAPDYQNAQYVQISLGFPNNEAGLRAIDGIPDGLTEPLPDGSGRKSVAAEVTTPDQSAPERFFYFDVHDSYINGGLNKVTMTITYLDQGLSPVYLDYDSLDTVRPTSTTDAVVKKRVTAVNRTNTEAWRTIYVTLEDARFENHQQGGADFRIGSVDELVLRNVSVLRVSHEKPQPPIRVVVDGREVQFDVAPFVDPQTSRTLVPMRAMFTALGVLNENIYWNQAARTAEARKGQTVIALTIDNPVAYVNFLPVLLDQPAVIVDGRTLVPLRFVSEQFGLKVHWNAELRVITMTTQANQP